ncbi:MAG: arsenate reductase [Actinobacteria bacterium QS_8_72_14]|nr:MAG: arsenate reductase [Actinobacteria bacterium QS_8_72_14]
MARVQLFTHPKSQPSRKAKRFFSERGVAVHEVDCRRRAPAVGELRRFVERYGAEALLDPHSRSYQQQGLAYLSTDDEGWLARLADDPSLLRLPLARCGDELVVGEDPNGWQRLIEAAKG